MPRKQDEDARNHVCLLRMPSLCMVLERNRLTHDTTAPILAGVARRAACLYLEGLDVCCFVSV